jgi:fatty acid desaturase
VQQRRRSHSSDPARESFFPSRRQLAVFLGYVAAAALYVLIGVFEPNFLFSFFTAIAYLLIVAWLVPALVRRLL